MDEIMNEMMGIEAEKLIKMLNILKKVQDSLSDVIKIIIEEPIIIDDFKE